MNESKSQMEAFPFLPALVLFGAFCLIVAVLLSMQPRSPVTTVAIAPTDAPTEVPSPTPESVEVALASYDPAQVRDGQILFSTTCSACHGMNARGVPGLGKDLINSEFVHGLSDEELLQFIIAGRPSWDEANTTGIDMPARGGNPSLNNDQILHIIAYLRTENTGTTVAASQPTAVPAVVQNPTAAATSQPISVPSENTVVNLPPVEPRSGGSAYAMLCAGCHGANGEGTANNGPAIADSELLADEAALVEFLTHIERIVPEQGFVHAPRGGYPPLTDEEVEALTQYLRELTQGS